MSSREIQAERDFLVERHVGGDSSWVGASSDAMLTVALTGGDWPERWPSDPGDLGRCEETYRRAPEHLQWRMLPWLKRFREHVEIGGLRCRGCNTSGHGSLYSGGRCEACKEPDGRVTSVVIGAGDL